MPGQLADGIYEELITAGLDALIRENGRQPHTEPLDRAESAEVLAAHLEKVATRVLDSLPFERRLSVANAIIDGLLNQVNQSHTGNDHVAAGPAMLLSIGPGTVRPQNPLRRADLLINARGEPALHEELAAEIASADRVDLLCAFIKWQGLRLLLPAIEDHHREGRPLRVITTT